MTTYTTASVTDAGRLCKEAAGMPQDKAAIAAMIAEAFINGMKVQLMLSAPAHPQKAEK